MGSEGKRAAVEVGEFEVRAAREDGLGDFGLGHANAKVVIAGPEAGVEEITGGRCRCRTFSSPIWPPFDDLDIEQKVQTLRSILPRALIWD